jgi:hypothetical protein
MKPNSALLFVLTTVLIVWGAGCRKSDSSVPPETTTPPQQTKPMSSVEPINAASTSGLAMASVSNPAPNLLNATNTAIQPLAAPPTKSETGSPPVTAAAPDGAKPTLASLSQDQVVRGLQEALGKGLQHAITRLGHDGGFLTNASVKIPMPDKLQKLESGLRLLKQDKLADDFVATLNHAAEQAVPQAGRVFVNALSRMSIPDAKSILAGTNDAATQYFRRTTQTNLYQAFLPIVQKATRANGVTAAYQKVVDQTSAGGLGQQLGTFGSALGTAAFDKNSVDLDSYVTTKALDGLFKIVADEEKQIRQNPAVRTTELMQKVFGALMQ